MATSNDYRAQTRQMLHELVIPAHWLGYKVLCEAIPLYAENCRQSITKELYPALAKRFGYASIHSVEHPIRYAVSCAWERRDAEIWDAYFPRQEKAPSNLLFIATLAEYLK